MTSSASPALALDFGSSNRYERLTQLPNEALLSEAARRLRYELDLPAEDRRRAVLERLHAWLQLSLPEARKVALAFDGAASALDGAERDLLHETEEDAVMDGLSYGDFRRLSDLMPSLRHWRSRVASFEAPGRSLPSCLAAALALTGAAV